MSSITVYIHYEPEGREEKTSKIVVPAKWTTTKMISDVIELFAKAYNTKNPDNLIVTSQVHLINSEKDKIYSNVICGTMLGDHSDYYIKEGVYERGNKVTSNENDTKNKLRCKNYGCQKYYDDDDTNHNDSCTHHTGPPVFHDTSKYWSCCPNKKAYDFDSFQEIVGCAKGKHSQTNIGLSISASPNATATVNTTDNNSSNALPTTVLKSISDYNSNNPEASSAASSASKMIGAAAIRKSSRKEDGFHAKCQRRGCQKDFKISENTNTSCCYHSGQPIFHDAVKFWSCCANTKCYDFDEFMAVKGCCVGQHDDGVIALES